MTTCLGQSRSRQLVNPALLPSAHESVRSAYGVTLQDRKAVQAGILSHGLMPATHGDQDGTGCRSGPHKGAYRAASAQSHADEHRNGEVPVSAGWYQPL